MAAEFDEPLSDSVHSGSISFGRFEPESLSWERRSSFSHNRYLEEVEKYSKPGSVTEKKAYFEAHFKKKALQSRSSSEGGNATEYQSSENGFSEHAGYKEEFGRVNEGCHFFPHFKKSPDGSEYDEEYVVMEFGSKDLGISSSEPQVEPALTNVVDGVEHVKAEETTLQTETGNLLLVSAEPAKEVKENLNDEAVNVDVISKPKPINPSPNSHRDEKVDSTTPENQQHPSAKARSAETKLTKRILKPQVNVTQVRRNVSVEAYENFAVKSSRRKGEGSPRTNTEKQSSHTGAPTTRLVHRISKPEDHKSSKGEVNNQNKREKDPKAKKATQPHHSASEKVFPGAHQTENRPKQNLSSSTPGLKKSAAVFNFRSDERAERRKEARKQENTVVETKQFRRSLSFKSTPKPEDIKSGPNSKAVSSTTKSMKVQPKSSSLGERDTARSTHPKAGNDRAISSNGSTNTAADPPRLSGVTNGHSATSKISGVASTNKQENDFNLRKHQVADDSKAMKARKSEGKQKLEAGRRSTEIVRKGMRSIHTKTGSGIGNLALGVAS
ncbi:protein WVD2-like 7 [Cornus florida]|uniref:protein WVD2-like 7 n=1 Tax=Cornus florida TaxID=4283 RepID=UPI00289C7EB5|nr:protein WVD2-like 7 [Cornus florida]